MITSCWKKILWTGAAMALAAPLMAGCSNGGGGQVCDPGSTQPCVCGGGVAGGQVCSEDGKHWGACDCDVPDAVTDPDVEADVSPDVDAADETACDASCGPVGTTSCDGGDLLSCQAGDDGCPAWTVIQSCPDAGLVCREVEGIAGCREAPGNCSLSGAPCAEDGDCPEASIEGFCLDTGADTHACFYDAWLDMPQTETCSGHTVHTCYSLGDCPGLTELSCARIGSLCGDDAHRFCYWSYEGTCASSSPCDVTGAQVCVICGNDEIDSPQEECDDGNTTDGDGCSARCQFERHCFQMIGGETECGCMTLEDCNELCADVCVGADTCDQCA